MYKLDKFELVKILMYVKYLIILVFISLHCHPLNAQKKNISILFRSDSPSEDKVIQKYAYLKEHADTNSIQKEEKRFLLFLQREQGYLTARKTASQLLNDSSQVFTLALGKRYYLESVSKGNIYPVVMDEIGFKEKNYAGHYFSMGLLEKLKQQIITYSENNGHPFATVRLDSFQIRENRIQTAFYYEAGPKIIFDTFKIEGSAKTKQLFLRSYLKIREKQDFSQFKIDQIPAFLQKLPYFRMYKNPSVTFALGRAYINLYLNQRKANQIDGILGFLPNEQKQGELLLTGEFNLQLRNLFYSGKTLKAEWQRIRPESQTLNLEYEHPSIFKSSFDLFLNFNLLKQDTTFLNIERKLALYYNSPKANRFSLYFNLKSSKVLSSTFLSSVKQLPPYLDINLFIYGIGYERNKTDNYFYPRKGHKLMISTDIGAKNISKNPFLADSLYSNLKLNSSQFGLKLDLQQYFPLGLKSVLLARQQVGYLWSEQVFFNDLYRLGGLNSIRGHNQNVFFASSYLINTLEYRLFFEEESYFLLFYDQSWYQSKTFGGFEEDRPYGLGLGVSFAVKAGIFNLVYALGGTKNESLDFTKSKIHFGLVSRF